MTNLSRTHDVCGLWPHGIQALWVAAVMLAPAMALAALGEHSSTVERDAVQMRAQRAITSASLYSVHELQLPGGTMVREYVTAANQVFAVAWNGPSIPDLQQLLGTYFPRFTAAAQGLGRARRPVAVEASDLVIHTAGHTRAFSGVAYLPNQMPSGVRPEQLR